MMKPYEPPPDYPMVEESWRATNETDTRSNSQVVNQAHIRHERNEREIDRFGDLKAQHYQQYYRDPFYQHYRHHDPQASPMLMRTRQFPEVAGIYGCEEQPALRRFTRYNQSMMGREQAIIPQQPPPPPPTAFSKSSKKPSFFMGNWTFRDRKQSRTPLAMGNDGLRREDRPLSMNLSDMRGNRSRSETSARQLVFTGNEFRIPVRMERPPVVVERRRIQVEESPERVQQPTYTTNITVEDVAVLRPKKSVDEQNNNIRSAQVSHLRKSCPDLDTACANMEEHRFSKKRNRRAKEKARDAQWKRKELKDWTLDDVLLWLQHCQLDEVASLLIGYDLRGTDLLMWDQNCLTQLGVTNIATRTKILDELAEIIKRGPEEEGKDEKKNHKTLFDIVRQTSYDQVLAVETPLTTRDITVTHGRLGCLQITKVNGANLPLKEHDCLLEINERAGEQFKSALMLTKLISDSNGEAIRFVVLRRKTLERDEDSSNDTSSSGVSSSPQTPTE